MTHDTLDRKINEIIDAMVFLAGMVEQALLSAVQALVEKDLKSAKRIYKGDGAINEKRYELETETISLIARHQPVASDLRTLAAIFEILTELERMGDYAKGIAKITRIIGEEPFIIPLGNVSKMAELTVSMLHRAVEAFVERDHETALSIPGEDDQVDELYYSVYAELIGSMTEDPSHVDQANNLLWAAHNLERTADRVTNICERIVYVVTGELSDIDTTDDE
ncbi:phosphate signaling complex protein PhoU, partial [Chloroflexota bacterium]